MDEPDRMETGGAAARDAVDDEGFGPLRVHAADVLRSRLRAAGGVFTTRWSSADNSAGDEADFNELFPLCMAWRAIHPDVACDLIRSALAAQNPDGSIARRIRADGHEIDSRSAWPFIAAAADLAAGASPHPDFIAEILPPLESYLANFIARLDPEGTGAPRWPSADEAFLPDIWEEGIITVDAAALLLAEIEAYLALAGRGGIGGAAAIRFDAARKLYERSLMDRFWDAEAKSFRDRDADGAPIPRATLSVFMPLAVRSLDPAIRATLTGRIVAGTPLGASGAVALWERWPDDPVDPPAPAIHQTLIWGMMHAGHLETSIDPFRARMLNALETSRRERGCLPPVLSAPTPDPAPDRGSATSSVMAAALVVAMLPPRGGAAPHASRGIAWMERHRWGLATGATLAAVLVLLAAATFTLRRRSLPGSSAEATLNLAREYYRSGDPIRAIELYRDFLDSSASDNGTIRVLLGNALFRAGRYEEAEAEYRRALNEEISSLHALYNLGLSLNRQGRRTEAAQVLRAFAETYETDYPDLIARAKTAVEIIDLETTRHAAVGD